MDTLTAAVNHAYDAHRDLLEVKQSLEHDIFLKSNSLAIDRCTSLPVGLLLA
jgi:hypothetical protein